MKSNNNNTGADGISFFLSDGAKSPVKAGGSGGSLGYSCSNGCTYLSSAELYDPSTGTFRPTSSMTAARAEHTATLLPNGEVLVAGGQGNGSCPPCNYLASAEVDNPSTGTWTATGSMTTSRSGFTATLLHNGLILVTGGDQVGKTSAELFDPHTGTWTATGSRAVPLTNFTTTLLPSGEVLVAGGISCDVGCSTVADAALYDPSTGLWTPTGSLVTAQQGHVAVLLPNGQVLVAGGYLGGNLTSAELYDPSRLTR